MRFLMLFLLFSTHASAAAFLPRSFEGDFKQTFKSVVSGKEKQSTGKIQYLYPGHLRLEVKKPDPSTYVCNPHESWYYTPPFIPGEKGEAQHEKKGDSLLSQFFDGLKNGLTSNALYDVKKGKGQDYELTFKSEAAKRLKLKRAVLDFKKAGGETLENIERMTLIDLDGKEVVLVLEGLKCDVSFTLKDFEFKPPANTQVKNL